MTDVVGLQLAVGKVPHLEAREGKGCNASMVPKAFMKSMCPHK